jgi:coenzyme F420-reducing hydrogenase delta subunit/Pyruvate/2-oxoacid:ferredoxin oxidoreductase delta subunit
MILGSGACARRIAANLDGCGIPTWLASGQQTLPTTDLAGSAQWLKDSELITCRGFAGRFSLRFKSGAQTLEKSVPAVVIAEDAVQTPNYAAYGLNAGSRTITISELEAALQLPDRQRPFKISGRIAFFCGWRLDSHPPVADRMLTACYQLQQSSDITTCFFTGNLKVAADGAEERVQQAKQSGTVFVKFSDDYPVIESGQDDRYVVSFTDELTRSRFRMPVDWMVVDETITPAPCLSDLAAIMAIHLDENGFAQADNVRRLSNATNRRGIFVAGGSRGILSAAEQLADADQISMQVLRFFKDLEHPVPSPVAVQQGRCVRCLTCHRLCPHAAIEIGARISVVAEACEQCGICLAGCPAGAIEMEGLHIRTDIDGHLTTDDSPQDDSTAPPRILVYACTRSAGRALELARLSGAPLPEGVGFIEVPCGGTVSSRNLLDAFESGADGVMLCTCHGDNCQSEIGNRIARKRADGVVQLLAAAGVQTQRLCVASVAANMGVELADMIGAFAEAVAGLDD